VQRRGDGKRKANEKIERKIGRKKIKSEHCQTVAGGAERPGMPGALKKVVIPYTKIKEEKLRISYLTKILAIYHAATYVFHTKKSCRII
jgi:hypothetical protein